MEDITFFNGGRRFSCYYKGNNKYDIYSGGRLHGLGVDLLLIKMLFDYCKGRSIPFILGQDNKDAQDAHIWWNKQSRLSQLTYSNEVFGKPELSESDELTENDIVKIWKLKS